MKTLGEWVLVQTNGNKRSCASSESERSGRNVQRGHSFCCCFSLFPPLSCLPGWNTWTPPCFTSMYLIYHQSCLLLSWKLTFYSSPHLECCCVTPGRPQVTSKGLCSSRSLSFLCPPEDLSPPETLWKLLCHLELCVTLT